MDPTFRASGRPVWLLPTIFFATTFVIAMISDRAEVIPEFFGTSSSRNPEAGIVAVLITFPTVACCFYALGIRGKKQTDHS